MPILDVRATAEHTLVILLALVSQPEHQTGSDVTDLSALTRLTRSDHGGHGRR
jgi:hypothetical protein